MGLRSARSWSLLWPVLVLSIGDRIASLRPEIDCVSPTPKRPLPITRPGHHASGLRAYVATVLDILLRDLSNWTFDRLTGARQAGFEMREESITENLLIDLHSHPSVDTRIFKTSATGQEPEYGPDWLWSIFINDLNLTMWVQAKKATGEAFLRYDGLAGDHAKRQALRLLLNDTPEGQPDVGAIVDEMEALFVRRDEFDALRAEVATLRGLVEAWSSEQRPQP